MHFTPRDDISGLAQDHIKSNEKSNDKWSQDKSDRFGNLQWATRKVQLENRADLESEDTPQELMPHEIAWDVYPSWGEMGDPDEVDECGWPKKKKKKKKKKTTKRR